MRCKLLFIVLSLSLGGYASAGFTGGNPAGGFGKIRMTKASFAVRGQVKALRWTAINGRSVVISLDHPLALDESLPVPRGEWVELTLIFDGSIQLEKAGRLVDVALDQVTIPLDWPLDTAGGQVDLTLDLPADLDLSDPDGLGGLVADNLRCTVD